MSAAAHESSKSTSLGRQRDPPLDFCRPLALDWNWFRQPKGRGTCSPGCKDGIQGIV